jgi:4-alpha-glucanotransferase
MSTPDPFDTLAAAAGIEPYYHDIWGNRHALSLDTKRVFLDAMGLGAQSEAEAAERALALTTKRWRRALEPVTVLRDGAKDRAATVLFDAARPGSGTWCVVAEDGRRYEATLSPESLPLVEARTVEGRRLERRRLALPEALPLGYHRLEVAGDALPGGFDAGVLIVAPRQAYLPERLLKPPGAWGFGLQLYCLQGRESWGIGDFGDLAGFAGEAGRLGCGAVGLNPLHALFPGNPAHASPYSPSSRCFLNPLYVDIAAVPDLADCPEARDRIESAAFRAQLGALRGTTLVDYVAVAALKLPVLERLHAAFRANHLERGTARAEAFRRFQRERGVALESYAVFEALSEQFRQVKPGYFPWRDWPQPYRDPHSPETAAFARENAERIAFHQYLQWEADRQLGAAASAARQSGMAVGLYCDLAVGIDADGAEAWADQKMVGLGISIGAPPDPFNLKGQSWGLPPFNPHALREAAYRPFIECLRANMRHAGALRIDHVMGFTRLFWIPGGARPADGGYVRYPLDDMLAITALESERARCAVIGEDLGTVPEGLRERLAAERVLSMRLLYFARRDDGGFREAESYPEGAHVAIGTHDLPTFPGYWHEDDVTLRAALHLLPSPDSEAGLRQDRARMRAALLAHLRGLGLLPPAGNAAEERDPEMAALVDAAYRFLAGTPSRLLMVQIEDVLGVREQINLPGTVDEHPNWRRKLPAAWQDLAASRRLQDFAAMLSRLRPGSEKPVASADSGEDGEQRERQHDAVQPQHESQSGRG